MVDIGRIQSDIEQLKKISAPCNAGTTRIGFTKTYRQGVEFIKNRMRSAGLSVREDNIGNIYGKLEGKQKNLPVILSGSHLDTVRCAGAFDGIAGVVCALEAARMIQENKIPLRHSLEIVGIIEEEGTRFGQVLLGSKFITGIFGERELNSICDSEGYTLKEISKTYLLPNACPTYRKSNEVLAFLELHDEQGPLLEAEHKDIGIVENIVAISWITVTVNGFAGHAGTVPMPLRQDAMTGASSLINYIINYTTENYAYKATATIGRMELFPGSSNCISSKCIFTVDLRSGKKSNIDELITFIQEKSVEVASKYGLEIKVHIDSYQEPIEMDKMLRSVIQDSCQKLGYSYRYMDSGAGHDAMIFSSHWPSAMLFIPCVNGITHNPEEYVSQEALAKGTNVLYQTILALDRSR